MTASGILIVEDESIIANDLKAELESAGFPVVGIASNGRDALKIIESTDTTLVLMDIHIKGNLDGVRVAREVKNRFNVPIVFLTGYADEQTIERVREIRPDGFLLKPFNQKEVRAAVSLTMASRQGKATRHREHTAGAILAALPAPVVVVDASGIISMANRRASALFACPEGPPIGRRFDGYVEWSGPGGPEVRQAVLRGDDGSEHRVSLRRTSLTEDAEALEVYVIDPVA